jgi:uncharacterized protein
MVNRQVNRLINEKSPYLLQHAYNPVDWHPWGAVAFEKAQSENKPIFLSIGYSTCHWCHVMEKESFEDHDVARMLNDTFISIKVDREERPDLDNIYMAVCQMMTGSGGWPLTIIMTPDKKPLFAGTYIPKETRFGRLGLMELIPRVREIWADKQDELSTSADKVVVAIQQMSMGSIGVELGESDLRAAYDQLKQNFDNEYGGFGSAPKFPNAPNLLFLLRYWKRTGNKNALHMVEKTLTAMQRGGIFDHIGLGFHRYSTDAIWQVPHFEKMLYDQALLSMVYTEAYQATGKHEYGNTARDIFSYVVRDMTSPTGGFYSAEDADSEGEEGKYYLWTEAEISSALSKEEVELITKVYDIEVAGNFIDQISWQRTGNNILHQNRPLKGIADDLGISESKLIESLDIARQKLFTARQKRVHPLRDDKILTDWNGLMISALAKGAQVFDNPEYTNAAVRATDFILKTLRTPEGRLIHRYRDGQVALPAYVDDYTFFVCGLIDLYETTFDASYLRTALDLNMDILKHFWDEDRGGFYFTSDDGENLIVRKKEIYDGAIPSGNSVAMMNLLRLGRITASSDLEDKAKIIGRSFSSNVKQAPSAYTQLMMAVDFGTGQSYEVVIAGNSQSEDTRSIVMALRSHFIPNMVVILRPIEQNSPDIINLAKYTKDQINIDGKATAYVCKNGSCNAPTTDLNKILELVGVKQ